MMSAFWKQKKVLVTGADGFIGSHLTERLAKAGAQVRAYAYYNSFAHWGWLNDLDADLRRSVEIFPGDIRDSRRTSEAVEGNEIVFHLASLIAIPYSYHAPESYVQTNVQGGLNVLNACRFHRVSKLIHTSTSEVYGSAQYVPIDESHPLQGQSPYSASKIAADMMAESFYRSFGLPVTTIRPFNTFGPRQSSRAVIPTILSQLHAGSKQIKLGALSPTRDFNFVADTVAGFLAVAEADDVIGQVINIGSGAEIAIGDLVKTILDVTGKSAEIISDEQRMRPEKSEVDRLLCDNSKAKEKTGWQPAFSLEDGLEITSRWVKENLKYFDSDSYTI
jgi:NAD dependent epimerase/dehydratase